VRADSISPIFFFSKDEEGFVYTGSGSLASSIVSPRPSSERSGSVSRSIDEYFGHPSSSNQLYNLTPQLQLAADFRVPTNEAPPSFQGPAVSVVPVSRRSISGVNTPVWEPDNSANECRRCRRKFSLFVRKHHCRRCGLVVCGSCSTNQDRLELADVVLEPGVLEPWHTQSSSVGAYRTCDTCHAELSGSRRVEASGGLGGAYYEEEDEYDPRRAGGSGGAGFLAPSWGAAGAVAATPSSFVPPGSPGGSDVSELGECPVCGTRLADLGPEKSRQEAHVQSCLERGGGVAQNTRYLGQCFFIYLRERKTYCRVLVSLLFSEQFSSCLLDRL
jgi:hypothetical protein